MRRSPLITARGATILGQQGGMDIERAETGHGPHHFGQHAESHDHLQVGLIGTKLLQKIGVFHLHRLQHRYMVLQGILLDLRGLQRVLVSAHWFVGLCNNGHHMISSLNKGIECADGKLGSAHKNDLQIFLFHNLSF